TPDFRSYFLIRIKLAKTVNEIHGDLLSTLQRWHTAFDNGVFALEKKTHSEEDDDSDGVHLLAEAADRNTMIEYLRTTGKRFFSLKKDKIRLKDCLLMWGNARPHTATDTRKPVKQSPYSPDLSPCDRFLFQKLKHLLREDEFGGHEEATLAVQRAMRRVSEDELYDQLRKLRGHRHDVIAVGGYYVY
ncbi:Uncharacterized protein FKW44_013820, partial [Caligus rogercresseyi]